MKAQVLSVLLATSSALAQGTFQNLDFEAAIVPTVPPQQAVGIPITNALPGWTCYYYTNPAVWGFYNGLSLGSVNIGIVDAHTSFYSNDVVGGYFTAVLQSGNITPPPTYGAASITQTGIVPLGTHTLLFDLSMLEGFLTNFSVSIGGQTVPFTKLSSGPNFATYGANISALAGQTTELRFSAQPLSWAPDPYTGVFLDNIRFSDAAIPSPAPLRSVLLEPL